MTLRITEGTGDGGSLLLRLEGRVVDAWAAELERCCMGHLARAVTVRLEMSAVRFVDREGRGVLQRLRRRGAVLVNASALLMDLLDPEAAGPQGPAG